MFSKLEVLFELPEPGQGEAFAFLEEEKEMSFPSEEIAEAIRLWPFYSQEILIVFLSHSDKIWFNALEIPAVATRNRAGHYF